MECQRQQREKSHQHGVPIKNRRVKAGPKISPQRHKKFAVRIEWDAADYVAQRSAEEDR